MSRSLRDDLDGMHPKMLAVSDQRRREHSEAERKRLAEQDWRVRIGQTIAGALELAHLTKQEMSFAMGYADQSAISRWIAGVERPLFDKLFAADGELGARFLVAWVIACAETTADLEVTTNIRATRGRRHGT